MKVLDRIILFFYAVLVLIFSFIFLLMPFSFFSGGYKDKVIAFLSGNIQTTAISLLMIILSCELIYSLFTKKKIVENKYVEKVTESGQLNISHETIKQMVVNAIRDIEGVNNVNSSVLPKEGGIEIRLTASFIADLNIPDTTGMIQSAIKDYVERMTGLKVLSVSVAVTEISNAPKRMADLI